MLEVHKFGGKIVSSRKNYEYIANILQENPRLKIVVVSAAAGVTNKLQQSGNPFNYLNEVYSKLGGKKVNQLLAELQTKIDHIDKIDLIAYGEKLSSAALSDFLDEIGMENKILDPCDFLIVSGERDQSIVLLEQSKYRLRPLIKNINPQIIIVPGYYGINQSHEVSLLGRSGTDYSATSIAYCADASKIIIWKETDGFMTADPHLVQNSQRVSSLTYHEATEISNFGAVILHDKCITPAQLGKIPIEVKNFYDKSKFTIITDFTTSMGVKSVAFLKNLSIIRLFISAGGNSKGIVHAITKKLLDNKINIISLATSHSCISLLINKDKIPNCVSNLMGLQFIDDIELQTDIALICLVGQGISDTPGIFSKVFTALADKNINVAMISAGASPSAYHFTVPQDTLVTTLNAVHAQFFGVKIVV